MRAKTEFPHHGFSSSYIEAKTGIGVDAQKEIRPKPHGFFASQVRADETADSIFSWEFDDFAAATKVPIDQPQQPQYKAL